jgi:hypothetical protein
MRRRCHRHGSVAIDERHRELDGLPIAEPGARLRCRCETADPMNRLRSWAVILAAVATCAGCAAGRSSGGGAGAGTRTVVPGATCAQGSSRPVPARVLIVSLRAYSVGARRDTYCLSPDAVGQVSNVSLGVSEAQQRRVHRRQGDVLCLLTSRPGPRKLKRLNFGKRGPLLAVLNVSCNVYPVGNHAEAQIRRVVAALEEIQRRYS